MLGTQHLLLWLDCIIGFLKKHSPGNDSIVETMEQNFKMDELQASDSGNRAISAVCEANFMLVYNAWDQGNSAGNDSFIALLVPAFTQAQPNRCTGTLPELQVDKSGWINPSI